MTGGGTGGHVGPALAVLQTLQRRSPALVVRYLGSEAGIEARLAREAGIEFVGVATGKLRRSSRGPLGLLSAANLRDLFRVPLGVLQSLSAVRAFRPDVVLATGGYVSVPPVLAAWLLRVPILTHEQTVTVGLANRIAGRFATRIALTFEGARDELPAALRKKAFVTGNPVREAVFDGDRARAARRFGFVPEDDALPCLYVTGGAQGARVINQAVAGAIEALTAGARVLHQCGAAAEKELEAVREGMPPAVARRWQVMAFVPSEAIGDAWALCDLLLARAGAGTVTEACAMGKPAVFVPLVPASGDEQTRNAQRSAEAGGAVILRQADCDPDRVREAVLPLLSDPARRAAMGAAVRKLATPRAADDLAEALLALGSASP